MKYLKSFARQNEQKEMDLRLFCFPGMWMICEGLSLSIKTSALSIHLHGKRTKLLKAVYLCIGWGIPLLIVLISVSYLMPAQQYMDTLTSNPDTYRVCWVSTESNTVLYTAVIPFALIITLNLMIVTRSGCFVYKVSKETDRMRPQQTNEDTKHILHAFKAVAILIPVLGLTWVFAFLISKYS